VSAPVIKYHYVTREEVETGSAPPECPGRVDNPEAAIDPAAEDKDQFCMYEQFLSNLKAPPSFFTFESYSGLAAELELEDENAEFGAEGFGSWAVTAH
jgi:hypothetical protein